MDLRKWKSLSNGDYAETSASLFLEDGSVIENDYDNITAIHNTAINQLQAAVELLKQLRIDFIEYCEMPSCEGCDQNEPCNATVIKNFLNGMIEQKAKENA